MNALGLARGSFIFARPAVDDVTIRYAFMRTTEVRVGNETRTPVFDRHNINVELGVKFWTFGLTYQRTDKNASTPDGRPENGLMATVGYTRPLASWLRFAGDIRVALTPDTDESQPLYAADTDLHLKLVGFSPDGWFGINHPLRPASSAGIIINRFGRIQLVGGLGFWWRNLSIYTTGLYAVNGVEDPINHPNQNTFADLQNAFINFSGGYDININSKLRIHIEIRRNLALRNAGNDTVGVIEFRYALSSPELEFY